MELIAQQFIAHESLKAAIRVDLRGGMTPESYADSYVRRYGSKGYKVPFTDSDLRECILAIAREIASEDRAAHTACHP